MGLLTESREERLALVDKELKLAKRQFTDTVERYKSIPDAVLVGWKWVRIINGLDIASRGGQYQDAECLKNVVKDLSRHRQVDALSIGKSLKIFGKQLRLKYPNAFQVMQGNRRVDLTEKEKTVLPFFKEMTQAIK